MTLKQNKFTSMANIKDQFLGKLEKSHTQEVRDGEKRFKLTVGQLNGKPYVVLHDHPDMKSFGVFGRVPFDKVKSMAQ